MKRLTAVLTVCLALHCAAPLAFATTIHVPGDQPTIAAALAVASDGGAVLSLPVPTRT